MEEREHPDVPPGPARLETIGEFLKHEQVRDADAFRRKLALIEGTNILRDAGPWMDLETFRYIYAAQVLRAQDQLPPGPKLEEAVENAERILDANGVKYHPDRDRVEIKPGSDGGHPRRIFRDVVAAWWEAWRRDGGHKKNDADLRRGLASDLAPFFPSHLLDAADPDGDLKHTIEAVKRSSGDG